MLDADGTSLRDDLLAVFARGADHPLDDADFDALARRVLAYQLDHVPAYAGYCRARGIEDPAIAHWTRIPAVPTAAFKELRLLAAGATAEAVFRTSGTTRGPQQRGEHHVADLDLYRGSLRPAFRAALLPDDARLRFLSLVQPPDQVPDSSLSFMIGDLSAVFGADGSETVAGAVGVDFDALDRAVRAAADDHAPVLLLGTSAAFIHWLDRLADAGRSHRLPDGSRLMDTGGFKGRGRDVSPAELRRAYGERLGLPGTACINEYGMTEMLSQLYDRGGRPPRPSADSAPDPGSRATVRPKRAPPWVRSVAVDPASLEPLPAGEAGILRHLDLANLGSVAAIQTEDWGHVLADGRVVLEGRASGASPRGCSIAMDLLLESSR